MKNIVSFLILLFIVASPVSSNACTIIPLTSGVPQRIGYIDPLVKTPSSVAPAEYLYLPVYTTTPFCGIPQTYHISLTWVIGLPVVLFLVIKKISNKKNVCNSVFCF